MVAGVGIIGLLFAGMALPTGKPDSALYVAAKSQARHDDQLWGSRLPQRPTGDFLVQDGKLYLRVQTIYHHFLDDTVSKTEWTPDRLSTLLRKHPDLAAYLPDAQRSDGGIEWLKK
jgi:hypothetical protein